MHEGKQQRHLVANRADIESGAGLRVVVDGHEIALFKIDGEILAVDDVCTHAYASLSEGQIDGYSIECPNHAGRFDLRTGRALNPPAVQDIRVYSVSVDGVDVWLEFPVAYQ
jgi:nitrite reductase/ring-hydroxylating ferredoxin subunit